MANYRKRMERLQGLRKQAKVDSWLLSSKEDVFYYTGYMPVDNAFLFLGKAPRLFVSPLENEAVSAGGVDTVFLKDWKVFVKELKKYKTVGFDETSLLTGVKLRLKGVGLKPAARFIQQPREVKDTGEIREIRKALSLTRELRKKIRLLGRSETEIAREIQTEIVRTGSGCAFEPIVSAGPNGYFIHHRPGKRVVKVSDMVIVDMGAKVNGYCCDTTETYCEKVGKREREIMEDVKNIQNSVMDNICGGVKWKDVQGLYEKCMKKKGYKIWHRIGHGVGLSVHESVGDVLEPGMVLAIEPGVYIKKLGGCRFEDMILVGKEKSRLL